MKKAAIFDMDGLLFDTERLYKAAWEIEARRRGYEPPEGFQSRIMGVSGPNLRGIISEMFPGIDIPSFCKDTIDRVHAVTAVEVPEKPGIHEILSWMHAQGMPLAIASASSPEYIESYTKKTGIYQYFTAFASSKEVAQGKPAPDVFLKAAEKLGAAPEDCYVFEDGINGVKGGLAAGCSVIMIPDLAEPLTEFYDQCTAILPSLLDALEQLKDGKI